MKPFDSMWMQGVSIADIGMLDPTPEPMFDRTTDGISIGFEVPVALVSVIDPDSDRQFFKSHVGLVSPWRERQETPLSHSFCQYVVATHSPLVVPDAREHELVQCNLAIRDLGVIAYLGVPIEGPDGKCVAALCAISGEPREWLPREVELMNRLADGVSAHIRTLAASLAGEQLLQHPSRCFGT